MSDETFRNLCYIFGVLTFPLPFYLIFGYLIWGNIQEWKEDKMSDKQLLEWAKRFDARQRDLFDWAKRIDDGGNDFYKNGNFVMYNRKWLDDHLEQEFERLRCMRDGEPYHGGSFWNDDTME